MPQYDGYDYNIMGFGNDPLHSEQFDDGSWKPSSFLGMVDDAVGTVLFDDPDASSKIFGELTGYNKQQREFAYQEYMQDKQWAHDDPSAVMARLKRAGINLNTAAAGVAGSDVGVTGPSSPAGGGSPAAAVDSISGAIGAMSNAGLNAASADNQQAQAENTRENTKFVPILSHGQNMKYFGDFVQSMKDVGLAEINAGGMAFDMMSGGLKKALDYLSYCSGLRNVDQHMKNVKAQYDLMQKDIESYDLRLNSNLSLQDKQGLQAAAAAAKAKAETFYQESKNAIESSLPGATMLQGASYLNWVAWNYGVDSPQFEAAEKGFYRYAYQSNLGQFDARVNTIYDEMFNSAAGSAAGNADNEAYLSFLRQNEAWVKQYLQFKFSPDYEIFLSKLSGWIGKEYDDAYNTAEHGRGMPTYKSVLPHYRDYKK